MTYTESKLIWDTYYPKVFAYLYKRLNNREDVEDLTSMSMTTLLNCLEKKNSDSIRSIDSFAWKIAHNHLLNFIRTKSKTPITVSLNEDWGEVEPSVDVMESIAYRNKLTCLQECINQHLNQSESYIIHESILSNRTSKDLGAALEISPAALRKRLQRALKKLRSACLSIWQKYTTHT